MRVTETEHHGQSALVIATGSTVWTYQLEAGGFSSLRDRDGAEWIGFAPGDPTTRGGAANVFRGIPNLVYPDNVGHPGHHGCRSTRDEGQGRTVIATESTDGSWAWRWTITDEGASLDVERAPTDRAYWFLYEGTPAGVFDPSTSFWGSDREGASRAQPDISDRSAGGGPLIRPRRWAYFGGDRSPRVLMLVHETAGGEPSFLAWMHASQTDGMMVFGFGRDHADAPVPSLTGRHRFTVRFVEATDYDAIAAQTS